MKTRSVWRFFVCMLAAGVINPVSTPAMASGFSLGEANTDILFNESRFSFESSLAYVSPDRGYASLMGQSVTKHAYSNTFLMPNLAAAARLNDNISCAFTYAQPFGATSSYNADTESAEMRTAAAKGSPLPNYTVKMGFMTDEYGATCDVRQKVGMGRVHMLGGIFLETFDYKETDLVGTLHLHDDGKLGYRFGLAYDIPEYAMRFQVMYRSQVKHNANGIFMATPFGAAIGLPSDLYAHGIGILPQSVKVSAQTGVAPGWLIYGSVNWTNWKVLPNFNYTIDGLGTAGKTFNYKDGYTVQAGVGHEFTDKIAGTVNLTWDKGVGTGADISTDVWTLGLGGEYKTKIGTFGLGTAISYLTPGTQLVNNGASFDGHAKGDWALTVGTSYKIAF